MNSLNHHLITLDTVEQANALEELRRLIAFMQQSGLPLPPGVAAACAAAVAIPSLQSQFTGQVSNDSSNTLVSHSGNSMTVSSSSSASSSSSSTVVTAARSDALDRSPQSDAPEVDIEGTSSPPPPPAPPAPAPALSSSSSSSTAACVASSRNSLGLDARSTVLLSPGNIHSSNGSRRASSGTSFCEKQTKLLVSN